MATRINPFHTLYVTEGVESQDFVQLFSQVTIEHALPIYQPGNVIIRGLKGSGKSMLLHLLMPETRIAYHRAKTAFPIPSECRNFIGAGINLTWSGVADFGQRPFENPSAEEVKTLPLFFADFLNYWIVGDIIQSVLTIRESEIRSEVGVQAHAAYYDEFAKALAADICWFGYLEQVSSLEQIEQAISQRILTYRNFLQYNIDEFPVEIRRTKTRVGDPISRCVHHLKQARIIPKDLNVLIRIDQYEELQKLETSAEHAEACRQIIHKALGSRDPNVSYRIGMRPYAWPPPMPIFGTSSHLEGDRNYKLVDLDEVLKRHENRKSYLFPSFAKDVFYRRLKVSKLHSRIPNNLRLEDVFGSGEPPEERAQRYARSSSHGIVKPEIDWPAGWSELLETVSMTNPLSAKLGEAWLRQSLERKQEIPLPSAPFPWDKKTYWRKERIQMALMQIATKRAQRMIWWGTEDLIALSGGNILVFVSLCQHIWGVWMRTTTEDGDDIPKINPNFQAIGIQECSSNWFDKIPQEPGGSERQKFIRVLGTLFQHRLANDEKMSYPGHNGFSILEGEVEMDSTMQQFFNELVNYGDMTVVAHTTKEKNRKARSKWYLGQILSPFFRIPVTHVKEPWYVDPSILKSWLHKAGIHGFEAVEPRTPKRADRSRRSDQIQIFR